MTPMMAMRASEDRVITWTGCLDLTVSDIFLCSQYIRIQTGKV